MFELKQTDLTYKSKKFTVKGLTVSQSIAFRSRFRKAQKINDEVELLQLMVEMILAAVVKPKLDKKKIEAMGEDDLCWHEPGLTESSA